MTNTVKTVLKVLGFAIGAVLVFAVVLIGWLTVTEFKPQDVEAITVTAGETKNLSTEESITVLTFNTGYGGLGEEADFFMDGGNNVRTGDKDTVLKNIAGITDIILSTDADILLLQEVDENSKRTFNIDQTAIYNEEFGTNSAFAYNYLCNYVPFPVPTIGKVASGVMTFSDYEITEAQRVSLPCPFSWPVRAANIKRCIIISRMPIENSEKELVAVNFHLEAYDDGEGKIAQTKLLWSILEEEYAKGNYVIAGGDFNQSFPGALESYPIKNAELWTPGILDAAKESWAYAYDTATPTCRLLNEPYDPASENTQYYVIDGFILSPNVELISAETLDCGFEFSDHNPVRMEIKLK